MGIDLLPDTVPELLRRRCALRPDAVISFHQASSGAWLPRTAWEHYEEIRRASSAFRRLGLRPGERLAIVAHTRREWHVAEMAGLQGGAVVVGVDPQASAEQMAFVFQHAEASGVVTDQADRLVAALGEDGCSRLKFVVTLDSPVPDVNRRGVFDWESLTAPAGSGCDPVGVGSDDPATIIYTAGTTGTPKGIEYSHRKIMAGCRALAAAYSELREGEAMICWLPMAHLYQRMMNLLAMACGMVIYFAEQPREILRVAAEVRPTLFFAVPRFYEKLAETLRRSGDSRSALRELIGDRLRYAITGAAPVPIWVHECLLEAGLPLVEAYGVSENPVPIATNLPGDRRPGSVGKPFPANKIRLADDGEVLVCGPALFSGYYREVQSALCFTADGYYKTGDLGRFDEDGFLFLEGRKAEIIKTSTGRRISPGQVEAVYGESPYLDRVVVCGNGRKHLVALVNLNRDAVAEALGTGFSDRQIHELLVREFDRRGEKLAPYERVGAFAILEHPLSVAAGELTPTLKLRRKQIESRHAGLIERLYGEGGDVANGGG